MFSCRSLRSEKAFTLIELMVVVGIIGILVAIAAPNFARYQSKARQSEAKIALAGVYTGEKAFYSEYNAYVGDHAAVGYVPEGSKRFYDIGWAGANTGTVNGWGGGAFGQPSYTRVNYPALWSTCTPALSTSVTTNDVQTFSTTAAGQIRDGQPCDVWSIDNDKVINNVNVSL
jgi:type IV pilus assembly protein PilA